VRLSSFDSCAELDVLRFDLCRLLCNCQRNVDFVQKVTLWLAVFAQEIVVEMREIESERVFFLRLFGPCDDRNRLPELEYRESPDAFLTLKLAALGCGWRHRLGELFYGGSRANPVVFKDPLGHACPVVLDYEFRRGLDLEVIAKAFECDLYPRRIGVVCVLDDFDQGNALVLDELVAQHRQKSRVRFEEKGLGHLAAIRTNSSP
jgi:hypothetical protein